MAVNNQNDNFGKDAFDFGIKESQEISSAKLFDLMEEDQIEKSVVEKVEKTQPQKKETVKKETLKSAVDDDVEEITAEEGEQIDLLKQLEDSEDEDEEEVETEVKSKEVKKETPLDEDEDDDINPFVTISKNLFELGIFTQDDPDDNIEISNGEELRDRFEYEKKKGVTQILENFLSRKGEEYRQMFDAVFVNGVHPKEYLQTYTDIQDFKNANLEDETIQKRVIEEGLRMSGFEEEDIKDELDKLEQYGELEDKARKYHKMVLKKQEEKLKEIELKEQQKAQDEVRKDNLYRESLTKILTKKVQDKEFDSIPVTPELAQNTMDYLYSKKWKTPSGKLITDFEKELLELDNPENYEMKVKLGLILNLMKKDPELKSLQRKAITKESNKVFSELAEKTLKKKMNPPKPTSWWNNKQ